MLRALARRALLFTFSPERAWREAAASPPGASGYLTLLAMFPAAVAAILTVPTADAMPGVWLSPLAPGSPFALALDGAIAGFVLPVTPLAEHASWRVTVTVATIAYAAAWLAVAAGALVLDLLLPWFSARRDLGRCMTVAAYSATPLLLASPVLLDAALAPIAAIAAMHACYVAYLGLPAMLGMPRSEAGMCIGISLVAILLLGQIAGYGLGAVASALTG